MMNRDQNINFTIKKDMNEETHLLPELMLYFVITGECSITIKENSYHITNEECILVNSGAPHSVHSAPNTFLAVVSISSLLFMDIFPGKNHLFLFQTQFQNDSKYQEMVRIIRKLIYHEVNANHKTDFMSLSLLYQLMDYLIEHYLFDTQKDTATLHNDDLRIMQLMQYINQNYKETVSLSKAADELFVSKSTLSRLFKKETGVYFADYVNQVRIRSSLQELLHTDKTITRIALDNGFSNPSAFHRVFTNYYHVSPSDFRKEHKEQGPGESQHSQLLSDYLLQHTIAETPKEEQGASSPVSVETTIDVQQGTPFRKAWNKAINMGSVTEMTTANMQYHALYLAEQLGFRYIRLWNVFSKDLMITDDTNHYIYNYGTVDAVLDFLVNHNLRPYFDFGNRPDTALSSEGVTIYYKESCVSFATKDIWQEAVYSFINHVITRYGSEVVNQWKFELSYDSVHPMHSVYQENFDYHEAYQGFSQILREILPDPCVGVSMFTIKHQENACIDLLRYTKSHHCIPDFVSFMIFPYDPVVDKETGKRIYQKTLRRNPELYEIKLIHQILQQEDMTSCAIYVSECNSTLSNRNFLNDSCFRGTYFAKNLPALAEYAQLVCPWMGSDWISNYYDMKSVAFGGSGLITKDMIRKPAYYAISFLNRLGDTLLEKGENYIVTSNGGQSYYILCFNHKEYSSNYYMDEKSLDTPDEVNKMLVNSNPITITFALKGLVDHTNYIIKRRTINQDKGALLHAWADFHCIKELTRNDVKYLRDYCSPSLSMETATIQNSTLTYTLTLQNLEISLLHIYKTNI